MKKTGKSGFSGVEKDDADGCEIPKNKRKLPKAKDKEEKRR